MSKIESYAPGSFCWADLATNDPESSKKFYAEMFGWQIQVDPVRNYHLFEPQRGPGGAFVQVGETAGAKIGEVLIYVFTDDIEATLAKAEALGAKTLTPRTEIPQGWFAVFADPQQSGAAQVDLIHQRQIIVPFGILDLVYANSANRPQD